MSVYDGWEKTISYGLWMLVQGLRSEKVGVIDAEYILHKGIPSLSGASAKNVNRLPHLSCIRSSRTAKFRDVELTYS